MVVERHSRHGRHLWDLSKSKGDQGSFERRKFWLRNDGGEGREGARPTFRLERRLRGRKIDENRARQERLEGGCQRAGVAREERMEEDEGEAKEAGGGKGSPTHA